MPIVTQAKSTPFIDSVNLLKNAGDPTKTARFSLSGLTSGASRVYTVPDQSGTLPLLERTNVFTANQQVGSSAGANSVLRSDYAMLEFFSASTRRAYLLQAGAFEIANEQTGNPLKLGVATGFPLVLSPTSPNVLGQAQSASHVPLALQGAASQSADMQRWNNSVGTQLAGFNADCTILTMPDAGFTIGGGGATHNGGYLSTVVGSYSTVSGNGNTICGGNSYTQGVTGYATFFGYGHYGGGYNVTAVGKQCLAYYDNAIAIGTQSAAYATSGGGPGAIAVGAYAYSDGANVVAFNTSPVAGSGTTLQVQGIPSVFVDYAKAIGNLSGSWIDSVLASRRGRLTLSTYEVATAQEALRIDSASDQARVGIGGAVVSGQRVTMYAGVATDVVQVLKGAASQTGDLFQTQNSVGTTLMKSTAAGYFRGPDGSAAAPTYSFSDNTFGYTGIYRQTSNGYLTFSTNGSMCGEISTSGMNVYGGYPAISLNNTPFVQDMYGGGSVSGIYFAVGMTSTNFFNPSRLTLQRDTSPTMTVTVGTASHVPFVSKGTTSQTGDLAQYQNSVGTVRGTVTNDGCLYSGTSSVYSSWRTYLNCDTTANNGLYVQGSTAAPSWGSTAVLLDLKGGYSTYNSDFIIQPTANALGVTYWGVGTYNGGSNRNVALMTNSSSRVAIDLNGLVAIGNDVAPTTAQKLTVYADDAATVGLVVKGAVSQTAPHMQLQNSVGTAMANLLSLTQHHLMMRNGANRQDFSVETTYSNDSEYRRLVMTGNYSSGSPGIYAVGAGGGANSDLWIAPDGTGSIKLVAGGGTDKKIEVNQTGLGFYGVTTVARPTTYTQTYATATRTHSALTSATLTDSTGGTANTTVQDVTAAHDQTILNNNFADLIAQINALRVDLENAKQVINSLTDDLQAVGLLQ